ncbi:hypothetical protein GALL_335850 [mine drainage metagenome]|uniref:Uncharacterized protein n=1 Tax=mine drainage metagenome TaxID=410659 RepID=A0A1J5QMG7_9ZZZZ
MSEQPERGVVPTKIGPRAKGDFRTIPMSPKLFRILATLALVALCVSAGYAFRNAWVSVALAGYFVAIGVFIKLRTVRKRKRFNADYGGSLDAVRSALDLGRLREVRDEKGENNAVREVCRQVPQLTVAQAMVIVRTL